MKLHLERPAGQNAFTGYGPGWVDVNGRRYERNLIVMPEAIITEWQVDAVATLTAAHFADLAPFRPEILLLGSGAAFRLAPPTLVRALAAENIGVESLDTHAACRTYNILLGEGRLVAAALFLG